jgi:hypothetical protein
LRVIINLGYAGGERDLKEDDPSIVVEDFFGSFVATGICTECQNRVAIAEFECA